METNIPDYTTIVEILITYLFHEKTAEYSECSTWVRMLPKAETGIRIQQADLISDR
jgi:hypothetical protein